MTAEIDHVIWDWNGTLLDDAEITARTSIEWLEKAGRPGVSLEDIREHSSRDFTILLTPLLGRRPDEQEIREFIAHYVTVYEPVKHQLPLAADALAALGLVEQTGRSQSILSMAPHEDVNELAAHHGISTFFVRIDGDRTAESHSKLINLRKHIDELGCAPSRIALIGDALDDFEVASAVGARPIMVETGMYSRRRLGKTGAPVASTLLEAISHLT